MKKIINFVAEHPVAITAVVCFVFYFLPFKPKPFGDGEYHEGTIQLIQFVLNDFHGIVRVDKGLFTLFYYFIPYLAVYYFKNQFLFYLSGVVFNSIMICFGIKYLFKSFDLLHFSKQSKFWTLLCLNLFPIHVYYCMGILAEAGSFFAVCLLLYLWIKITLKTYSKTDFSLLAVFVVMLFGFRPNLLLFVLLLLIYILVLNIERQHKLFFAGSLILLIFFLIFAEKKLSNNDGEFKREVFRKQLLWSRFELRDEPLNWLPQHGQDKFSSSDYRNNLSKRRELDSICDGDKLDKTTYYMNWVKNDIIDNPGLTVRQYVLKFFQSQSFVISPLMKSNKSNFVKYGVHIYINSINYLLLLTSLWTMFILVRNREYQLFFPILFLWGSSLVFVFLFHSEQRYMFPMRPVLAFLFAYFVNYYYCNKESLLKIDS